MFGIINSILYDIRIRLIANNENVQQRKKKSRIEKTEKKKSNSFLINLKVKPLMLDECTLEVTNTQQYKD